MTTILYFAWVRERIGAASEDIAIAQPIRLADLLAELRARSPRHDHALGEPQRLRAAVNQEFVGWDHPVKDGDEVAIFPPVTGG